MTQMADLFKVGEGLLLEGPTLEAKGADRAAKVGATAAVKMVARHLEDYARAERGVAMTSTSSSPGGSVGVLPDEGTPEQGPPSEAVKPLR